jgi:hypothetical protein
MQYLIIEETQYQHTDNNYHIEDQTNDYDKAIDMLQGYKLINKRKDRTYSILKYESPLLLTKEMEVA